jgi:hypothetical protein
MIGGPPKDINNPKGRWGTPGKRRPTNEKLLSQRTRPLLQDESWPDARPIAYWPDGYITDIFG